MAQFLPAPRVIHVDTRGAVILNEESPETRDSRGIYLPNHIEPVSHIALDIGGSLAKVVFFTRSSEPPSPPLRQSVPGSSGDSEEVNVSSGYTGTNGLSGRTPKTGALTPLSLEAHSSGLTTSTHLQNGTAAVLNHPPSPQQPHDLPLGKPEFKADLLRRAQMRHFPGGSLNFERFETDDIGTCIDFIRALIERSAELNHVPLASMRESVKIIATGGGAHRFYDLLKSELGVEVHREDEMECLITGLGFITLIPRETYWFSDELVHDVVSGRQPKQLPEVDASTLGPNGAAASTSQTETTLERPSPNPPRFAVSFEESSPTTQLPCLLVNIGSGVSIIKVDADGSFERVSGTSLGGGTLWGLLSLLTGATSFDEMLSLSEKGNNENVDMLVGDIYGQDYSKLGLKSTMIASSFGKVFKKGETKRQFSPEDISKSLLYALSNNIGQIAYMNAEKYNLDRIYFGGCFIRGHAATIATLSYAIRFWSKGTKRALFLRHEGFLGAIGAWIKNIDNSA
ncbi:related to pantothenate kinase [Serendipita indica DSM 11827]|uniref:Related to pantothenate kinase n=1 Tax=Serendipita indica (strain DSM 11827) TaxID=1109443 RepID=G4TEP6_SERID|nr:related to pantothenate kinase [Serendipita indica DSM 11827]